MSHFGNRIACSIPRNLEGSQRVTIRRHTSIPLPTGLAIRQHAQDVIQIRAVCCTIRSHCVLPDLQFLLTCRSISSPTLGAIAAQHGLILNDHAAHRSFPMYSPKYTIGFVKSFVSTKLMPDRTSICAVIARCDVNSCVTASSRAVAPLPFLSALEPHQQWP